MQTSNQLTIGLNPKTNQEHLQQALSYLKTLQEATEGVSYYECSFDADSGNEQVDRLCFVGACHFFAHHSTIDDLTFFMEVDPRYLAHQNLESHLKQLLDNNNRLRRFGFYQSSESISDATLAALSLGLITNKSLTQLSICHLPPDEDADELVQEPAFIVQDGYLPLAAALIRNSTLLHLNLERGGINISNVYYLVEAFSRNYTLTTINIARNDIEVKPLTAIVKSLMTNRALTSLNLSDQTCYFTEIDEVPFEVEAELTRSLGELASRPGVQYLNLSQLPIGRTLGNLFAPILLHALPGRGPLLSLYFEFMIINDANMRLLVVLLNLNKIQDLFLFHTKLSSASYLALLSVMENNTALSAASLSEPEPDENTEDVKLALARMIAYNRSLTSLKVAFEKSTEEKWLMLIEALKLNPTLTSLGLYNLNLDNVITRRVITEDIKKLFERNHSLCYTYADISTTAINLPLYTAYLRRNRAIEKNKFLQNFLKILVRFTLESDKKRYEERALMPYFHARSLPRVFRLLPDEFPNRVRTKQAQDCILRFQNRIGGDPTEVTQFFSSKRKLNSLFQRSVGKNNR